MIPYDSEPPPFLGTWKRVYIVVLVYLALVICAMYVFSIETAA